MTILRIGSDYRIADCGLRIAGRKCDIRYPKSITPARQRSNGGRNPKNGFTFFEAMVTVAILSFGIVIIFQGFLTSLNVFDYYLTHLKVQSWANEKIWEVSDRLVRKDFLAGEEAGGQLTIDNKNIAWNIHIIPLDDEENIFKLSLFFFWDEGKRKIQVQREAYAGI